MSEVEYVVRQGVSVITAIQLCLNTNERIENCVLLSLAAEVFITSCTMTVLKTFTI